MRIFWMLIALLVVAAMAVFAWNTRDGKLAPAGDDPQSLSQPQATTPPVAAEPAPVATSAPQAVSLAPQPVVEVVKPETSLAPVPALEPAPKVDASSALTLRDYAVTPANVRPRADGATVVDELYVLRGEGTAESPYLVSWEMLVATEADFDPSVGKNAIPQRVAMLDGKVVTLEGYIAFPLMSPKPSELLMMLNPWDGCCIGVPPTVYDAVEVKLNKTVTGDARFAVNGAVTGTFKVEPYVTKTATVSWLNGLFLMENAEFSPRDIGVGAGS
jgi:hypothetical protein